MAKLYKSFDQRIFFQISENRVYEKFESKNIKSKFFALNVKLQALKLKPFSLL